MAQTARRHRTSGTTIGTHLKRTRAHWNKPNCKKCRPQASRLKTSYGNKNIKNRCTDVSELPALPEGWVWVSLSMLAENIQIGPFGSLLHKSDYVVGGIPWLILVILRGKK